MVKKPAKVPEGHVNSWFWERGSLQDDLPLKLPEGAAGGACAFSIAGCRQFWSVLSSQPLSTLAGYAERVQLGEKTFDRYPENLLHSRVRYSKAFKVRRLTVHCCMRRHSA